LRVLQKAHGIGTLCKDVVRDSLDLAPASLDAVFSVASMEHWHASPKRLFADLMTALKPGGVFVLGAPNCVNLRKRLTVPFGYGKWSTMASWYETEPFRGHVREPDVDDLRYIARDIGLVNARILGSNYMGYISRFQWIRHLIPLGDRVLRLAPSLCSEIYVRGEKLS
jgi:SAM-dependent methyltransferase